MDEKEFNHALEHLPRRFGKLVANYYNGPFLHTPAARVMTSGRRLDAEGIILQRKTAGKLDQGQC